MAIPELIEQNMVQILTSCVETELCFFQVDFKFMLWNAFEFWKPVLGKPPETFDAVDVFPIAFWKLVFTVVYAEIKDCPLMPLNTGSMNKKNTINGRG